MHPVGTQCSFFDIQPGTIFTYDGHKCIKFWGVKYLNVLDCDRFMIHSFADHIQVVVIGYLGELIKSLKMGQ